MVSIQTEFKHFYKLNIIEYETKISVYKMNFSSLLVSLSLPLRPHTVCRELTGIEIAHNGRLKRASASQKHTKNFFSFKSLMEQFKILFFCGKRYWDK